jgi:hypothetical protein
MFVDVFMMKDMINPFNSPSEKGGLRSKLMNLLVKQASESMTGVLSVYDGIKNVDQMMVFIT